MGLFVQLDLELKLGLGAWKSDAIYELWQCNSTRLSPIMNSAYSRHCLQQCLIFSSLSIFCSHWKWMVGFFYGQPVSHLISLINHQIEIIYIFCNCKVYSEVIAGSFLGVPLFPPKLWLLNGWKQWGGAMCQTEASMIYCTF